MEPDQAALLKRSSRRAMGSHAIGDSHFGRARESVMHALSSTGFGPPAHGSQDARRL
jgi:hypothetical protein